MISIRRAVPTSGKFIVQENKSGRKDDDQRSSYVAVYRQQTVVLPKQMERSTAPLSDSRQLDLRVHR
jgi:hypothetical protein